MKESNYTPIIIETIGENGASIGTIKNACGQGHRITNIRKALFGLLMDGIIEVNGFDEKCKAFKTDCIMFKKVNPNYRNPIYVKKLLEDPLEGNNYDEIQKVFKNRIEQINRIFQSEVTHLEECIDKIPLEKAIESKQVGPEVIAERRNIKINNKMETKVITLVELLKNHPHAEIWYLKKKFYSDLGVIMYSSSGNPPYFEYWSGVKLDLTGNETKKDFVQRYFGKHFSLPINEWSEQELFKHLVIGALKEDGNDRDETLWELAFGLTDDGSGMIKFVKKLSLYLDYSTQKFLYDYNLNL